MDRDIVVKMLGLFSAYAAGYPMDRDKIVDEVVALLSEPATPTDVTPE